MNSEKRSIINGYIVAPLRYSVLWYAKQLDNPIGKSFSSKSDAVAYASAQPESEYNPESSYN